MEKKYIAAIAGFIGFVSGAISLVQFYSFTQIEKITLKYYPRDNDNNLLEFIHNIRNNAGKIIMLDFNMVVGGMNEKYKGSRHPFLRNLIGKDKIAWSFDEFSLTLEINRVFNIKREFAFSKWDEADQEKWNETKKIFNNSFSVGTVTYDLLNLPDNGLSIILEGEGQNVNPFSELNIETEGCDIAYGPFQVSSSMDDAAGTIRISPAPYTKELSAQVKCAEKDWPYLVKFFVCPFL